MNATSATRGHEHSFVGGEHAKDINANTPEGIRAKHIRYC
jgi:hypothetical protein